MGKRLDTEIIINLAGNLTAKARQYGANMSEFAQRNQRAMSVVKATSEAAGRGLDRLGNRYTAAVAGFAGGAMLNKYSETDRRLTRMGITAGKTRKDIAGVFDGIQDVSIKFRVDTREIMGAYEEINGRTGDLDFALQNKDNIGAAVAGSGGSGESIGGLISEFKKLLITERDGVKIALDGMNKLGKEGAFELKDAAEKLPASISLYAAAGAKGPKAAMDVMAVAEAAQDVTANKDVAKTTVENFIRKLQEPKVVSTLKRNGVNVFDNEGAIRPLPLLLKEIAERSSRGGVKKQRGRLMEAGFDQYGMDLIAGVTSEAGAAKLKTYMGVVADGTSLIDDAKYAAQDFTSALQSLNTQWEKFSNSQLAKPVQELADALNSVDQDTVQNWLEIGKNVAIATGGLLVARKAFQIGKGTYDFLRPGKKGVPKDVTDVFGSGVMPVYVVNMGAGGMGGAAAGKAKGKGVPLGLGGAAAAETALGSVGYWGLARAAGTGAAMVYLQNEATQWAAKTLYDSSGVGEWAKGSSFRNWVDTSVDKSQLPEQTPIGGVLQEIKDWMASAPTYQDPSPWASLQPQNQMGSYPMIPPQLQGKIEVSVKDDRVQVTSVKINTPGVTMSAQTGISNVEQD
ncbi:MULTISPECIES: phage tail tape measure protein [unclassified Serratia (in: enterobacteria)]|uniref:phage tail tape measure protein n=1 Tax=unclassified Serratia (in: enterobacteria) TaxID=2647522 RepID=UPI0027EDE9A3|nr:MULTISPECIES: phage tail tape measure protein [unclassified Serratia (in: enterobacteria)]MDQ7097424.1 phage tail tape measure protein [Serratia sp. MF2]MDQ7104873.1 phage tail tape measure protein [Serratia sp. MF1(2023)]